MKKRLLITVLSFICFMNASNIALAEDKTIDDYLPDSQRELCIKYSEEYGISEELLESIIFCESSFKMSAKNGNCYGICQINGDVWGYGYDTEEKQIKKMCDIIMGHIEECEDVDYVLARYNGQNYKSIMKRYEAGTLYKDSYVRKVTNIAYELEYAHDKHNY